MSAVAEAVRVTGETLRSVIDLRAFAADADAGVATAEGGDAWFAARRVLPFDGAVTVAVMTLEGQGRATVPADEFVFVLSGALALDGVTLAADRGAMVPQGVTVDWTAAAGTCAIVVRYNGPGGGADRIVPVDLDADLSPSNPPAANVLQSAVPSCRNHTDYRTPNGEFSCGVWDSTPYRRCHIDYPHAEMMHLIAGSVTFEDDEGARRTYRQGDLFLVLPGARCSWLSEEDCAKLWVIYRPVG
ncbi:cupin domain-containing protein [Sphingomonas adhaesiva]|uniref:cupin domain-containing protein n=1 Tax=Sphingomonas adhaesiva TaxID=28212 RepID=UPI002FF61B49